MVTIRLMRRGGKKEPFYHVVVTDSRRSVGGTLEQVGFFNPVARGGSDADRIEAQLGEDLLCRTLREELGRDAEHVYRHGGCDGVHLIAQDKQGRPSRVA